MIALSAHFDAVVVIAVLLGLIVGSFLNVVIYRLPIMLNRQWRAQCEEYLAQEADSTPCAIHTAQALPAFNLSTPRSRCPHCNKPISALENIPLLSYLFLRGHCRGCGAPISACYPLVEAFTALLSGIVVWQLGPGWPAVAGLVLTWVLIALAFIDADHQILPDDMTLPLIWAGLALNINGLYTDLTSALIGAIAGYLSLWLVYHVFRLLTGKEGMGYGDFKLLAALGAWLGWQALPIIILLSSLVGAVFGIVLILFHRHGRGTPIPFGPYLASAGWLALLWGHTISQAYLHWAGV